MTILSRIKPALRYGRTKILPLCRRHTNYLPIASHMRHARRIFKIDFSFSLFLSCHHRRFFVALFSSSLKAISVFTFHRLNLKLANSRSAESSSALNLWLSDFYRHRNIKLNFWNKKFSQNVRNRFLFCPLGALGSANLKLWSSNPAPGYY